MESVNNKQNNGSYLEPITIGGAIGGITGGVIAHKKTVDILKTIASEDNYVRNAVNKNFDNILKAGNGHSKKIRTMISNVSKKAKADFPVMSQKIAELAKNTKIKWIAGGIAIGAAVGILYKKLFK